MLRGFVTSFISNMQQNVPESQTPGFSESQLPKPQKKPRTINKSLNSEPGCNGDPLYRF